MSDNNIIRFPTNARERKRYLAKSENALSRRLPRLRTLTGWALLFSVVLFVATNFTLFSPASLSQAAAYLQLTLAEPDSDLLDTIQYPAGMAAGAVQYNGGLAIIDTDTLYIAQTGGLVQQTTQLSYANPVLRTNGNRVLTFDRGGTGVSLSTAISTPVRLTLEDTIQDASLGQSNDFAVVTSATGYRAAVAVYSDSGAQRFFWATPDYYVQYAALSPSGKRMCALAFYQDGVELRSRLLFFDLDRDAVQAQVELGSTVGVALSFLDEDAALVLTDSALLLADRTGGEPVTLASYTADELLAFALHGDRALLATRSWTGSARATLTLYDRTGVVGTVESAEEPTSLSLTDREAAVLTASGLHVYDHGLTPLWENPTAGGASRVLLTDSGTVWTLYSKYAALIGRADEASAVPLEELPDDT